MRTVFFHPAVCLRSVAFRFSTGDVARLMLSDPRLRAQGFPRSGPTKYSAATEPSFATPQDTEADRLSRLEAVLLLAKEPLTSRKLAQFAGLEDGTQARTLIQRLNAQYDDAGRAFRVEEIAGGYQLLTRRKFSAWLRRLAHVPAETRLSAPALETLAVIAYRQPVLKADIEAIRGVNCSEILRQLMERDLVRINGRSQELGHPFLYATTRRFLHLFGLHSVEDLPRAGAIRSAPVLPGPALAVLVEDASGEASPSGQDVSQEYTVVDDDQSELETEETGYGESALGYGANGGAGQD